MVYLEFMIKLNLFLIFSIIAFVIIYRKDIKKIKYKGGSNTFK